MLIKLYRFLRDAALLTAAMFAIGGAVALLIKIAALLLFGSL